MQRYEPAPGQQQDTRALNAAPDFILRKGARVGDIEASGTGFLLSNPDRSLNALSDTAAVIEQFEISECPPSHVVQRIAGNGIGDTC
ncbi:MAG: hypothetical protein GDA49_05735 [Rhodospirillales bacterium]|nr:hypothetical protein [Rhodospirillales bacterium]